MLALGWVGDRFLNEVTLELSLKELKSLTGSPRGLGNSKCKGTGATARFSSGALGGEREVPGVPKLGERGQGSYSSRAPGLVHTSPRPRTTPELRPPRSPFNAPTPRAWKSRCSPAFGNSERRPRALVFSFLLEASPGGSPVGCWVQTCVCSWGLPASIRAVHRDARSRCDHTLGTQATCPACDL